jgi:hypothetical protein
MINNQKNTPAHIEFATAANSKYNYKKNSITIGRV